MAGLIGRLNKDIGPVFDREAFTYQGRSVAERGAGSVGVRYAGPIGLAHYANAGLINERNPLPYQDDSARYVLLFDGYPLGHRAQDAASLAQTAQVLIDGFHNKGIHQTLAGVSGSFALACIDWQRGELHLARSADGLYPLFWCEADEAFSFASTLPATQSDGGEALLDGDPATKPHDETTLEAYRIGGFIPADRTLAAGIRRVSPGSVFTLRIQDWSHTEQPIPLPPATHGGLWADTLRSQLRQTVDIQKSILLTPDGGIGGALLAALLHEMGAKQVSILLPPKELKLNTQAIELCARHFGYQSLPVSHADLPSGKSAAEAAFLAANGTPEALVWAMWLKAAQDAGHTVVSALGFTERYLPHGLPLDLLLKPQPPQPKGGFWAWLKGLFGAKSEAPVVQVVDSLETAVLVDAFARHFAQANGKPVGADASWPLPHTLYIGAAAELTTKSPLSTWAQLQANLSPDTALLHSIDHHAAHAADLRVVVPFLSGHVWQAWLRQGPSEWLGDAPDAAYYQLFKQLTGQPAAIGAWPQLDFSTLQKK